MPIEISPLQIVGAFFILFAWSRVFLRFRDDTVSLWGLVFWSLLWILVAVVLLLPQTTDIVANTFKDTPVKSIEDAVTSLNEKKSSPPQIAPVTIYLPEEKPMILNIYLAWPIFAALKSAITSLGEKINVDIKDKEEDISKLGLEI